MMVLILLSGAAGSLRAEVDAQPNQESLQVLGAIPVQHGGRIKPFESFAREAVLYVTGKGAFKKMDCVQLVWEWISRPEKWNQEPLIPVSYLPLARELSLKVIGGRISPEVALEDQAFIEKVAAARALSRTKEKLSTLDQKRLEVYDKAMFFKSIGQGGAPGWVAQPEDPRASWLAFAEMADPASALAVLYEPGAANRFMQALKDMLNQSRESAGGLLEMGMSVRFAAQLRQLLESGGVILPESILNHERTYLRLAPFTRAWKFYLGSLLMSLLGLIFFRKESFVRTAVLRTEILMLAAGMALHTYGFYLRCVIAGRPPVSNMYESIIWVSWAALFFSILLSAACRASFIRRVAALVSVGALILAQKFPAMLDPSITPLVPVLRSNLWLTVHVLTITMSYGAFALAWGLAHGAVIGFALHPQNEESNRRLCQYTYRAIQIGVILLAAGTVLGGVWANYSWGRFWGWDPKETWALIALLGYILVLHGRFAGWLKPFGFAVGSAAAFLGVVMAWYGVNFVLGAGLHSYGFGGGGLPYVAAAIGLDVALIALLGFWYGKAQHVAS
ncbi:MAG: hypothetical protein A2Y02_02260 [Omnitrophica bacterium GWA2_52_12]|nr:MAG: hypothetical protein A2Y02_02260 [Omnitrophica bacterium GWA2_52_12]